MNFRRSQTSMTRREAALGLALSATALAAGKARAQAKYPNRPVRVILPFGAGGVADVTSRLVAQELSKKLGQNFVIENNPGAGGITAARMALRAARTAIRSRCSPTAPRSAYRCSITCRLIR